MYTFRPVSDRIERLRGKVRDRIIIADPSKARIVREAQAKYKNYPPILAKPAEALYVIQRMHTDIEEDEYFAGDVGNKHWGAASGTMWLMMDIEHTWPIGPDGLHHAPDDDPTYSHQKLAISPEDLKEMREDMKKNMQPGMVRPETWLPQGADELFRLEATPFGRPGGFGVLMPPGHLTPGFQTILKRGYGEIRKQAQDWLDERKGNIMGDDMGKYEFYSAAVLACDGAIALTRRYADTAREKAKTAADPAKKAEYEKMAEGLDHIAEGTPRNFWEACQMYMLYHIFLIVHNGPGVTSMGRFDQYVWPYLKKDLEEGTITMEHAQELVDAFFLKLNIFYGGGFGKGAQTAGIGHIGQHTTIGGCDPKTGEDAVNPVSYMVLESIARLKLHEPTVSLRTTKNTPQEMWDCAIATSMNVGGLPLLQNDDCIIPGIMRELGFSLEDARNYAFIGCQEITGSGNDYPAPNGSAMGINGIYWPIALVMAINNGINPMNGRQAPAEYCSGYLYEMKSMEEVKAAYEKLTKWMFTWIATLNNYCEHEYTRLFPFPNLSISTEGCMESGKDVSAGGAKYNSYGGTATGLATVGDSLTALKYMVFDKKLVSGKEMLDAILANWEGYEPLRQRIINEVPHYGNADPYADMEQKYVMDLYYNQSRGFHNERCKVYKCGMFGAADHVPQGEITWATPDGRKAGTPIADAMSPVQGRDEKGPTSVFVSSCCFDHSRYMDGMAVNLKIHPTALNSDDGITKLQDMTKTYFEEGGMEVQYNVVDAATLRAAQQHPEEYHNLVVRIAGYSAYFVDMTEAMQNDVISRAEHSF
ncbi:MAG: hypothetical protein IKG89_09150 [Oscillospiraceae bacterium]|nr:hypothetical protein [Oscillospiraceae bacterium]